MTGKKLSRCFITLLFLLSAMPVASAYIAEYVFHIFPCKLCIYQRIPYIFLTAISFIYLISKKLERFLCVLALFSIITFLINLGLAFFNFGVEKKWFPYHSVGDLSKASSLTQFKSMMLSKDIVLCDQVQHVFLDLSFAAWNFIYSLLSITIIFLFYKYVKKYEKIKI